MTWAQNYDPLHNTVLSTAVAAVPILLLLIMIATNKVKTYWAAAIALVLTLLIAVYVFTMPAGMAVKSATLGAVNGFWTIGWIILNVIFLYSLTKQKGLFDIFQHSLGRVTGDRRLQILLIPFCFGAFFEGAAGFGTPVAVCSAMLMGLGFSPLTSAAMALFANTATVAFGAIGAPINGLSQSTGIDPDPSGQGHRHPVGAFLHDHPLLHAVDVLRLEEDDGSVAGNPGGGAVLHHPAVPDLLLFVNPYIVDVASGGISLASMVLFLRVWKPAKVMTDTAMRFRDDSHGEVKPPEPLAQLPTGKQVFHAWLPWVILCAVLAFWASPFWKSLGNKLFDPDLSRAGTGQADPGGAAGRHQGNAAGRGTQLADPYLFGHGRAGVRHHRGTDHGLLAHRSW